MLQAAINGVRRREEHHGIPISAIEIAEDARACGAAGAETVHLHVRGLTGAETLEAGALAEVVRLMRERCPDLAFGISTGLWITGNNSHERLRLVSAWQVLPDFASVNFDEEGSVELAEFLLDQGVAIEVGIATTKSAEIARESRLLPNCLRILIEPQEQDLRAALTNVRAIEQLLESAGGAVPRLLHGTELTAWALLREARDRGYDQRIGLEDVLVLPDGATASGNASLVEAARNLR